MYDLECFARWPAGPPVWWGSGCVHTLKFGSCSPSNGDARCSDLGLTLGHEQRGQQKGGTLSWRGQEVQLTATYPPHLEIHVPLWDMLLSFALLASALLS